MPFSTPLKILWTDVLPSLGLASISFQTVPSGPVSIRWRSSAVSLFVVNDNFFLFCPGLIRLQIVFHVLPCCLQLLKFLVHRTLNNLLPCPLFFLIIFFLGESLDIFRVNTYPRITPYTEYKIIVKFYMLCFSFYNYFAQNALRCFLSEF